MNCKAGGSAVRERAQAGEVHPAVAASVGAKHCTGFGAGVDDTGAFSLVRVIDGDRPDVAVLDARSDRFPGPAAVVASEETGTSSSAIHAPRVAGVDRDTIGRLADQVLVDGPGGTAPSDEQGRFCYDYDAHHDSLCSRLYLSSNSRLFEQRCFLGMRKRLASNASDYGSKRSIFSHENHLRSI